MLLSRAVARSVARRIDSRVRPPTGSICRTSVSRSGSATCPAWVAAAATGLATGS
jgi:hypothetical protein